MVDLEGFLGREILDEGRSFTGLRLMSWSDLCWFLLVFWGENEVPWTVYNKSEDELGFGVERGGLSWLVNVVGGSDREVNSQASWIFGYLRVWGDLGVGFNLPEVWVGNSWVDLLGGGGRWGFGCCL